MGCGACGSGAARGTVYQVRLPSGQVRRYLTQAEAEAAARKTGGTWKELRR